MAGTFNLPSNQATPSFVLKMDGIALDFENLDKKGLKFFLDKFKRKKMTVKNLEAKNTARRANGVLQKDFTMEFQDGQKIQIFVKGDGTIFQVKLNKKVIAIRNTTNLDRAVDELVGVLQKNASAFDRTKMLCQRRAIRLPKPRINTTRKQKIAEANTEIQALEALLADLKAQLGEIKDRLNTVRVENEELARELKQERNVGDDLQKQIENLVAAGYMLTAERGDGIMNRWNDEKDKAILEGHDLEKEPVDNDDWDNWDDEVITECAPVESSPMKLTLRDKFALQKVVREGKERLRAGIADPEERRKVQDEVRDALDKLTGETTPRENISVSELPAADSADDIEDTYNRLKNGEYNGEEWGFFSKKLEETCREYVKIAYNKSEPEDIIASSFACAKDIAIGYIAKKCCQRY